MSYSELIKKTNILLLTGTLLLVSVQEEVHAASLGNQTLPEELPKTTILLERRNKVVYKCVEAPLYQLDPAKGYQKYESQLYVQEQPEYSPIGSAVLISYLGIVCVVTAAHVLDPLSESKDELYFRIPGTKKTEWRRAPFKEVRRTSGYSWFTDEQADIAVTFLNIDDKTDDVRLVSSEKLMAKDDEIKVGDDVFVIGFPSSVISDSNIVRDGMVSAKLPSGKLLIDTLIFHGNSGGPVFWKPAVGFQAGPGITWNGPEISGREPKFLGLIRSYLPFRDLANSNRTGASLLSSENSGLAETIPASKIRKILDRTDIAKAIEALKAEHANLPGDSSG